MSHQRGFRSREPSKSRTLPYRRAMHSSFETSLPEGGEGPGFLSRLGIAVVLVAAGVGVAMWMAAAG